MYWAIVTASTVGYGDKAAVKIPGRILTGILILISLPMFGLFTAAALEAINSDTAKVSSPAEINGKIAVVFGSTGQTYAVKNKLNFRTYDSLQLAMDAMSKKKVSAILYDRPTLNWWANHNEQYEVSPNTFDQEYLAFAFNEKDILLKEKIDRALLQLKESGEMGRLQAIYFGEIQ